MQCRADFLNQSALRQSESKFLFARRDKRFDKRFISLGAYKTRVFCQPGFKMDQLFEPTNSHGKVAWHFRPQQRRNHLLSSSLPSKPLVYFPFRVLSFTSCTFLSSGAPLTPLLCFLFAMCFPSPTLYSLLLSLTFVPSSLSLDMT